MKKHWQDATQRGDCESVISLIDVGMDINSLDEHGQTALMNAAYRGDKNLVRVLVEHGADLDLTAKYRLTAIMLAVIQGHKEIVCILAKAGVNTDLKGSNGPFGYTPLEYALAHGDDDIVGILRDCT